MKDFLGKNFGWSFWDFGGEKREKREEIWVFGEVGGFIRS